MKVVESDADFTEYAREKVFGSSSAGLVVRPDSSGHPAESVL